MDEQDQHFEPDQVEANTSSNPLELSTGNNNPEPQSLNPNRKNHVSFDIEEYLRALITGSSKIQLAAILILVLGFVTNLISFYLHFTKNYLEVTTESKVTVALWVISVILTGISAILFSIPSVDPLKRMSIKKILLSLWEYLSSSSHLPIFHIILVAFFIRIIPIMNSGLYLDEWYWLDTAKLILKGQVFSPFGFIGDQPSNFPAFPVAFLLSILKNPILSVRLTGVLYSLLMIVFVYLFIMEILGKGAAVVGAGLIAFSPWDIHQSNLAWNNVSPNPMLVSATLLLLYYVYMNRASILTYFGLALVVSLSLHLLYVAALIIIPTGCVLAIFLFKNYSRSKLNQVILFGIFMLVCLSPIFAKIQHNPEQSIGRHEDFLQQNVSRSGETGSNINYYVSQFNMLVDDFMIGEGNFHIQGLWGITLSPLVAFLTLMGILLSFFQSLRKKENSFWLIILFAFIVLLIIPFVILYRTSSVWRSYAILPVIYILSVYALVQFSKIANFLISKFPFLSKIPRNYFWALALFLYVLISLHWFNSFLDVYQFKRDGYETNICQFANNLIDKNIPDGAIIIIPDEMCFPLITIQYAEEKYQFVTIRKDEPIPPVEHNSFLIILNSRNFGSYFNQKAQEMALQLLLDNESEKISADSSTQPVLYIIK